MENSHEPDQSSEGGNPTGGHNRHHDEEGIPPIPNGVPDSWMELLGGEDDPPIPPDLIGPEHVRPDHLDDEEDLERERPVYLDDGDPYLQPPPEPPEEWWDNQGPPDDLCEEGRSGGAPQNGAIPPLGLIHQLLDQISVQLKAQQMLLRQLQQEEFLCGEYRIERFQQVWEPLFRDHSLKEYIFQLQEREIQFPMDAVGEKVWAAVSQSTESNDIVSEWRRQIDLYLGEEGSGNPCGEDQAHD